MARWPWARRWASCWSRGLGSIGLVTILIGALSLVLASIKRPIMAPPGKHLPFRDVLGRIAPYGMGLAMSGVGYSVLATFVTLFYISRHWNGAALCLTAFGLAFVAARALIRTINRFGGFAVGLASFTVEFFGVLLLWRANSPWTAFTGAIFTGLGYSLVFPALGVEALKRVTENNRGSALGIFTAFADVSFFLVGPLAGVVIGSFGYASAFLFALLCILIATVIVVVLMQMRHQEARNL
jgi:predicted MFS family arabinose efflux permease